MDDAECTTTIEVDPYPHYSDWCPFCRKIVEEAGSWADGPAWTFLCDHDHGDGGTFVGTHHLSATDLPPTSPPRTFTSATSAPTCRVTTTTAAFDTSAVSDCAPDHTVID